MHPLRAAVPEIYRVGWEPAATVDLLEIVDFIAQDSAVAAQRAADKLTAAATSLQHHPHRGGRVPELMAMSELADLTHSLEIRELIVRHWRLSYVIEGRAVRVTAVVDSRRDMVAWLDRHIDRFADPAPRESAKRLARLGGSQPALQAAPRRRPQRGA